MASTANCKRRGRRLLPEQRQARTFVNLTVINNQDRSFRSVLSGLPCLSRAGRTPVPGRHFRALPGCAPNQCLPNNVAASAAPKLLYLSVV
jgi:hypothetical protein